MAESRATGGRGGRAKPGANHNASGGVGGLVGAGPSIVGAVGAMRARDVSRPTAEDLERAERTLVVRRRPADAPATRAGQARTRQPRAGQPGPAQPEPTPQQAAPPQPARQAQNDYSSSAGDSDPSDS